MKDFTTEVTKAMIDPVTEETIDQKDVAERLLPQAEEQGVCLVGPGGLLNQLTKNVLETALEAELTGHLGHEHGRRPIAANTRNGTRAKTVLTEIDPVEIEVSRDRNTPFDVVMGVTTNGERDILGIWAGDGGEGARFWLPVFSELKNGGVEDVLIAVCDGLKGLPEAITTTWQQTVVQQCVVHLIRDSFRYAGCQHRDGIKLWESARAESVPFLEYDVEIRRVICTTNAIEFISARYRRAVRARGAFPQRGRGPKVSLPRDPVP